MSPKEKKLFNEYFLQFHPLLFNYGKKIVADDYILEECIQELFLYIYQKEINLGTIKNIKAYLFTAFRRRILLKKKNISRTTLSSLPTDIQFIADDFLSIPETDTSNNQLDKLLNELPWRQREAIYLKYFNGLSGKEIAEVMGIQPQVVANTVYKAIKKLRDLISEWVAICYLLELFL